MKPLTISVVTPLHQMLQTLLNFINSLQGGPDMKSLPPDILLLSTAVRVPKIETSLLDCQHIGGSHFSLVLLHFPFCTPWLLIGHCPWPAATNGAMTERLSHKHPFTGSIPLAGCCTTGESDTGPSNRFTTPIRGSSFF